MNNLHYHIIILEAMQHLSEAATNIQPLVKQIVDTSAYKAKDSDDQALYSIINFYDSTFYALCDNAAFQDVPVKHPILFEKDIAYYRIGCGLKTLKTYMDLMEQSVGINTPVSFYVISDGFDNIGINIDEMYHRMVKLESRPWNFSFYRVDRVNFSIQKEDSWMMLLPMNHGLHLARFLLKKVGTGGTQNSHNQEEEINATPSLTIERESKPAEILIDINDKHGWIIKLINIHNRFQWEKDSVNKERTYLTIEDQAEAERVVDTGTDGSFSYIKDIYFYPGTIVQQKPLNWSVLYDIIIKLPFGLCDRIILPFDKSFASENDTPTFKATLLFVEGKQYFTARPYLNKKDVESIIVYFAVDTYEEDYDEDGFGGGTYTDYAYGVIDKEGYWAVPLKKSCAIDVISNVNDGLDPKYYSDQKKRKQVKWDYL